MSALARFVNRFRRTSLERELDDEIRFHLEERTRRNAAAGMSPRDAAADAFDRFGSIDRAKAGMRSARMVSPPTLAVSVLTLVVLSFVTVIYWSSRSPVYDLTVGVTSLALGMGANTAMFSLVDHLILRSLPVREPARLALVGTTEHLSYTPNYSYALFDAIASHTELFDGVLAVGNCCGQSTLQVGSSNEFVDRLFVSGSYFATLGVDALRGRMLTPADDQAAGGPDGTAAVLRYATW